MNILKEVDLNELELAHARSVLEKLQIFLDCHAMQRHSNIMFFVSISILAKAMSSSEDIDSVFEDIKETIKLMSNDD